MFSFRMNGMPLTPGRGTLVSFDVWGASIPLRCQGRKEHERRLACLAHEAGGVAPRFCSIRRRTDQLEAFGRCANWGMRRLLRSARLGL
jgi:hypothetical protein